MEEFLHLHRFVTTRANEQSNASKSLSLVNHSTIEIIVESNYLAAHRMVLTNTPFYFVIAVYLAAANVYGFNSNSVQSSRCTYLKRPQPMRLSPAPVRGLSVAPPAIAIDTRALLYQAYYALTVKEVKEILRYYGAKVSGSKGELIDRLGEVLDGKRKHKEEDEQNPSYVAKVKQKTLKEYNEMTLNELRFILKERGLGSAGNKRELIHRVMISGHETKREKEWQILEPSIQDCQYISDDEQMDIVLGDSTELPLLSGLLFVNKPSGWSTLPTKQQIDNPTCPTYPCLSDIVIKWLQSDPEGKDRLKHAQLDEQRWWDRVFETEPRNSKQRRELKKKIRQHEKLSEKMSTFQPRPAHRLDIDTSGIVCIALTPTALRHANMLFEKKSRSGIQNNELGIPEEACVEKRYEALLEGSMDRDSSAGVISHAIGKVWVEDHNEWACDLHDDGSSAFIRMNGSLNTFVAGTLREATTLYKAIGWETLQTNDGDIKSVTRVELTPITGRGHQLRLHMSAKNHPIVGDNMHGDMLSMKKQTQLCLHASKLSLDSFCFGEGNDGDNAPLQKCRIVIESAPLF